MIHHWRLTLSLIQSLNSLLGCCLVNPLPFVYPIPSVGQRSSDTAVAASGDRLLSSSGDMHSSTHSKLLFSSSDLRSVLSDTTFVYVGDQSQASLHTDLPEGPVSVVEGGRDVRVSSPDVTFLGFPSSD